MNFAPEQVKLLNLPSLPLEWHKGFPKCPAIYFAISKDKVLYIGKTNNLLKRWVQHHRQLELENIGDVKIAWLEVSDIQLLPIVEKALIQYFKPQLNYQLVKVRKPIINPGQGKGNRTGRGHFQVRGTEPLAKKPVMARLPVSIDATVRQLAGDELSDWIREAIAEKLEREQQSA